MRRHFLSPAPLLLFVGCSALVQIDDDKYTGGELAGAGDGDLTGTGGQNPSGGGGANGSGGDPTGGLGGVGVGGTASGGGSGGDNTGGTGGDALEPPEPVHYYPLDGTLVDEGSASHTALTTGPDPWRPSSGIKGGAYEVVPIPQGTDVYLALPQEVAAASPFALSFWFIPTADSFYNLVSKTDFIQEDGSGWALLLDNGMPRVRIGPIADEEYFVNTTLPLAAAGEWTHILFAYEENFSGTKDRFKFWVNGILQEEQEKVFNWSGANSTDQIRFGKQENQNINRFAGFIDEIRVYDIYPTDDEARAIYGIDAPQD